MKLICELTEQVQCITEEKEGKKNYFIEGIFMQADVKNKNGRLYPSSVMENEVKRYVSECVNQKRAIGELGHPQGPQINLDRASHLIESLRMDGSNAIGRAKILDTPMGNTVKGLLEGGTNLGVSSRGLGSLKPNNGLMEVQNDFRLVTAADIVADPSAPNAFVTGIMENVEYFYNTDGSIRMQEVAENTKKTIKKLSKTQLEESMERLFKFYLHQASRNV
jgi:hypothetical protein